MNRSSFFKALIGIIAAPKVKEEATRPDPNVFTQKTVVKVNYRNDNGRKFGCFKSPDLVMYRAESIPPP